MFSVLPHLVKARRLHIISSMPHTVRISCRLFLLAYDTGALAFEITMISMNTIANIIIFRRSLLPFIDYDIFIIFKYRLEIEMILF